MAKSGLSTFLYAELKEAEGIYDAVKKLSGAISYKEALDKNDAEVYADNTKKIVDKSVTGGSITLEVIDDDPEVFNPLLGRKIKKVTVGEEEKEVYAGNSNDVAIPIGFGFIENEKDENNQPKYKVNFYNKITFSPYDQENETKKKTNDYKTISVTGTIYNMENGDYKYEGRFTTMLDALKVLYGLFGAELPAALANTYAKETPAGA